MSEVSISAKNKPKLPIFVGRGAYGEKTNHIIFVRTKTEVKQINDGPKSPKNNSDRYLSNLQKKIITNIVRREISNKNSNLNIRDRKQRENGQGENNVPKTYFGTIFSDRKEKPKRDGYDQRSLKCH